MRVHPFREAHEELLEIIEDYEASDVAVEVQVYLGDLDISDELESGDISIDAGSAAAWTFNGTITDRIDVDYRNAPLRVVVDIGGIEMDILRGRASLPIQNDDFSTSLVAGTPGIFLDKVTLDKQVTYNNATPQFVIRDAVTRIPYYDRGRIRIPNFDTPLISRGIGGTGAAQGGASDAFTDEQHPVDIISSVAEEIDFVYFDTALGGFVAIPNPGVGEGAPLAWSYEVGTAEVLDTFTEPTFATPDEQFTKVTVRDKYEDGRYRIKQSWPVSYASLLYPPAATATMYLPFTDTDPEAWQAARQLAFDTAAKLSKGLFNGQITVAFNPFLEPYDVISIYDEHEDSSGKYRRQWQCVIEGISHVFGAGISTALSFSATLIRTERIDDTSILPDPLSAGVASTPVAGFVLGLDYIGEWVDPARITGPRWAGEDEDSEAGDWFDADFAPVGLLGEETVNGELLDFIDYLSAEGATFGEDDLGEWVDDAFISDPQWSGTEFNPDGTSLDWFDYDFAPLGLFGEDTSGPYAGLEWIDF